MRPLSRGQQLLGEAALTFRADPKGWTTGWGSVNGRIVEKDPGDPDTAAPIKPCCIDVMLMKLSPKHGGKVALDEARSLLYDHLGGERCREAIWKFNDHVARNASDAVNCIEAAAGARIISDAEVLPLLKQLAAEGKAGGPKILELAPAA